LARKNTDPAQAKVSKIPVELNEVPLVIDLPDGQKIILGKMQNGAVIEVATWHGTGRPDSRTNRFMIGMTNGDSASPAQVDSKDAAPSEGKKALSASAKGALRKADGFLSSAKALMGNLSSPFKSALSKSKELAPVDTTTELEINAWLNSITSEATLKATAKSPSPKKAVAKKSAPKKRT
jgi:hypothetical protein